VSTLKRRIGGVRAGSASYVWTLTPLGYRLLDLLSRPTVTANSNISKASAKTVRKRQHEPSPAFLQHTLAIAEVLVRLTELAACHRISLITCQLEPACWRNFTNAGGSLATLRPDLYVATIANGGTADYEDHWFIEVDLATESPAVVVRKCQQYLAYMHSGTEQTSIGIFPLVAWLVPDEKRKTSLNYHIAKNLTDSLPKGKSLFLVMTIDELNNLVKKGLEYE
jgi:hypothetical protein